MQDSTLSERIAGLYGALDWREETGILHVAAVALEPARVIAIGPGAPASPTDRFVLGFARARADAIVTTGAILRAEPELVHCYAEETQANASFARWRERILDKPTAPALVVLSASGDIASDHPALAAAELGMIWTTHEGRARLGKPRVAGLSIETSGKRDESLRANLVAALERTRSILNAQTILIEAGPTTSSALYPDSDPGDGIDELLLSHFGGTLEASAIGPAFVTQARIAARFGDPRSARQIDEASGAWRFERYRR